MRELGVDRQRSVRVVAAMAKRKIPSNLAAWITARRRLRLTHAQVQMARELGMNPRKLEGLANHSQESWKAPVPQFIEDLYQKRFGRRAPENVRSIEEMARAKEAKRAAQKAAKRQRRAEQAGGLTAADPALREPAVPEDFQDP